MYSFYATKRLSGSLTHSVDFSKLLGKLSNSLHFDTQYFTVFKGNMNHFILSTSL